VSAPLVSIVIPTFNGGTRLGSVLDAIDAQRSDLAVEVIVVDSGSTDGSAEWLARRRLTFVQIAPDQFDHGATRNLGIERSHGEYVVLLVQDALPVSDAWLTALVAPLREQARLAGTFARQIPRPDASPLTRYYLSRWIAAQAEPRVVLVPSQAVYDAWSPMERFERCVFDNVCACLRRSVWEHHRFSPTPIAEDLAWARDVLLAGYGLAYVPDAVVEHSHDRSAWYELKRTWVLHQQLHRLFGLRTIPTAMSLLGAIASSFALHRRRLAEGEAGLAAQLHGAALAVAWPLGQYAGGLTAATGRIHWRPRGV
jgi:glycosyltransferase involved in cell wall biosynthesis